MKLEITQGALAGAALLLVLLAFPICGQPAPEPPLAVPHDLVWEPDIDMRSAGALPRTWLLT